MNNSPVHYSSPSSPRHFPTADLYEGVTRQGVKVQALVATGHDPEVELCEAAGVTTLQSFTLVATIEPSSLQRLLA